MIYMYILPFPVPTLKCLLSVVTNYVWIQQRSCLKADSDRQEKGIPGVTGILRPGILDLFESNACSCLHKYDAANLFFGGSLGTKIRKMLSSGHVLICERNSFVLRISPGMPRSPKSKWQRRIYGTGKLYSDNTAPWTMLRDGVSVNTWRSAVYLEFAFDRLFLTYDQASWGPSGRSHRTASSVLDEKLSLQALLFGFN